MNEKEFERVQVALEHLSLRIGTLEKLVYMGCGASVIIGSYSIFVLNNLAKLAS